MRINTNNTQVIAVKNQPMEEVKNYIYLGRVVSTTGGTNEDIRRRLGLAGLALNSLRAICTNNQLNRKTKIRLFRSNVISILLYGNESWKIDKGNENTLNPFLHKC